MSFGGWERVSEKHRWEEVWSDLLETSTDSDLKSGCFSGSHALKLIYIRYLSLYEKFEAHINASSNDNLSTANLMSALSSSTSFFVAHSKLSADPERMGAADESTLGKYLI